MLTWSSYLKVLPKKKNKIKKKYINININIKKTKKNKNIMHVCEVDDTNSIANINIWH